MAQRTQSGLLQKVKLPLFGAYSNRGTNPDKDQRFVNFFPESRKVEQTDQTRVALVYRPGIKAYKKFASYGDVGRGVSYFNGKMYAAWGSKIYEDNPFGGGGTPTSVITMSTSTGKVGFVLGNSSTFGDYLFICDGVDGWYIDSAGAVTHVVDPDFPTPHIPTPVFLDGYICVAKGSDIYSCDLDTPSSWNASNFVSAESFPDAIVALARQNNQIVAFGSSSTEFFYDAANSSGSPFNRNESAIIQTGCAANHVIYQNERYCAFIGQSDSGGRAVWFIEGFQPKKVSDEFIERIIDSETDLANCSGYGVRVVGHMFYVINLKDANRTFVYDVDEKLWHEWSSRIPNSEPTGTGTPPASTIGFFQYDHATDCDTGTAYLQHTNSGYMLYFDPSESNYVDEYNNLTPNKDTYGIEGIVRTNRYDMDTMNRKRLHSFRLFSDRQPTSGTAISMTYTDDDYQSNSSTISIELTEDMPACYQLGSFRRRAFTLTYEDNTPMRLEAIELCYTEGIS